MGFLISNAQGVIGGDVKPPPEPPEIFLANSRLEYIGFYLFSRGHSFHKQTKWSKKNKITVKKQENLSSPGRGHGLQTTITEMAKKAEAQKTKNKRKQKFKKSKSEASKSIQRHH